MGVKKSSRYKAFLASTVLCIVVISSVLISGEPAARHPVGVPDDWSHHHLIFSNPGTAAEALAHGRFEQWYKIVNNPRYIMQQLKRDAALREMASAPGFATRAARLSASMRSSTPIPTPVPRPAKPALRRDWSMIMGGTSATQTGTVSGTVSTAAGQTITITNPANSRSITLTATPTAASATGTFTGEPASGGTVTITNGSDKLILTASTTTSASCTLSGSTRSGTFARSGTLDTNATHLTSAINGTNCGSFVGLATATSSGATVTVTASASGSGGNSIALAYTLTNFSWSSTTLLGGLNSSNSGTYFETSSTASTEASNIASAITTLGGTVGVSASSGGTATVTVSGAAGSGITLAESNMGNFSWTGGTLTGGSTATVGAGMSPSKYSFLTSSANCGNATTPDFVVYNTGLAGSSTQASIIAYDNLYSGCSGTVPSIYWQYNTDGGAISTSVVLSDDGTQLAFVQTVASQANLVLLRWAPNSSLVQMTASPRVVAPASYLGCTAPCMTSVTFSATTPYGGSSSVPNDTHSSPFYDDTDDVIFVGEDNGYMHKFSGIFGGTPAEVTSGGFPAQFAAAPLSGVVYDFVSGNVFAGPATGAGGGNYHYIASTGGSVTNSGPMAATGGTSEYPDAPIVDSTAQKVYIFTNDDTGGHAAVWQLSTTFGSGTTGTEETLGQGATTGNIYDGTFDNIYFTSAEPTNPVGNLYVCGRATGSQTPTLWRVPIGGTGSTLSAAVVGPALASGTSDCSDLTEFYNVSTDWIFLSVEANNETASPISCPSGNGCIMSFNVTSTSGWGTGKTTSATALATGGTSGAVIDNSSSTPSGTSQIYFTPLGSQACTGNVGETAGSGTGGCAIQAAQAGLD